MTATPTIINTLKKELTNRSSSTTTTIIKIIRTTNIIKRTTHTTARGDQAHM